MTCKNSGPRISKVTGPAAHLALVMVVLLLGSAGARSADWPQFRGPNRDGKSAETGLLKQWPEGGPKLLWAVEDLGFGYAAVAVAEGTLYTTGLEDKTGYLYAYDLRGTPKWKKPYGPGWTGSRPGSRSTPTVNDGLVYVMSGYGVVACFDAKSGAMKWSVDTQERFSISGGVRATDNHGVTESLLVDGDNVICTPGGKNAAIAALDKKTGETVWVCEELSDQSSYCSPIVIERGNQRLIVTLTAQALVGVDAATGKRIWRVADIPAFRLRPVSPVYEDGRIYTTSGYGGVRGAMLELSEDGKSITKKWTDKWLDCHHGGVIVHGGYVYGTSDQNIRASWVCLDLKTGKVAKVIRGVGKGSIAYADGMFYGYGESGLVGLIKASPTDFKLVSSFKITRGKRQHWAHPVIAHGRLYIRHGQALMAYDIKADQSG